jgi:hypothetical protein
LQLFYWSFHWRQGLFSSNFPTNIGLFAWRRGSESNGAFTDNQPQYPDFERNFTPDFTRLQASFTTTPHAPDLTCHAHGYYSVIEEIVEGFVEGLIITALPV